MWQKCVARLLVLALEASARDSDHKRYYLVCRKSFSESVDGSAELKLSATSHGERAMSS